MKRRWLLLVQLLLVYFAAAAESTAQFNPLKDPNRCGRPQCETGTKFNYKPGVKYEYQYSIDIDSLFEGTSKNSSSLHIDADVEFEFNEFCEGSMSFTQLRLSERENESPDHQHSQIFSDAITKYPLRFSFHDGAVTEICPSLHETNWVLNFKRGALTLMQNTMRRFDLDHDTVETDVHGTCSTKYTLIGAKNTSLLIEKKKDIGSCQDRYKHQSILQTTPYTFRSNYQAIPIMKSNVTCELSIDHHVYNEIVCRETHVFQPFSNKAAGATTAARQKLILVRERDVLGSTYEEKTLVPVEQRATLLYNHRATPKPTSGELRESRDLIKKLCKLSNDDMQIEFSDLFTKFIHTSRLLSHVALQQLYNRVPVICSSGKKHMLDALPFLGSSGAVNVMKDIIIEGGVPRETAHEWLVAFSFIPRPDEATLLALLDLLRHTGTGTDFDPAIALSVSSVAHSYCRHHTKCGDNEVVQDIVRELEERAAKAYHKYRDERIIRETIIVSMKGLANIGLVSEDFQQLMWGIILDEDLPAEIRVASVDAHRRLPCIETRDRFLELFRNQSVNTEVRIASYLQVMRCPDYITVRVIRHCLEEEEVNQVGSFIWSHLHNLLKSSIPSRIEIQGLLSDKDLGKKFSSDVRKFSHNYEGSVFFDEYNAGANYESNVIFSPSSYVPKSAMLNLTVDLFGESINLFEVNGRAEGLEHYLESVFGPKGPLNSQYFEKKFAKIRWPRSAQSPTENEVLKSDIDDLPNIVADKFSEPRVSLGMKVFGNELKYHTFKGDEEIKGALRTLNPVNYVKRMLSGQEINYNKAAMFLDTSYIVPSGAGLPITLNAVGTAAVNLKMFGALRVADFTRTKELDLVGSLRPSVTVDVIGTMSVDAYYASTGIKLKTNVYTSTAVEGKVKVRGAQLVSIQFSLPNEKTEIFSAHSEIVVMRGDVEEKQRGISENRIEQLMCSWPAVDKTIGLKLCTEYQFPNVTKIEKAPYFILAGPSKFRVSLQKADPTARDYVFEYRWNKTASGSVVSVAFDTPGSSVRRLLSANFTLDTQSQNLTLLLETAAGTTLAKGKYKNTDNEKYLYLGLDINGKKHFDARLSLTKKESKHGYTYQPKFYLGVNDERVAELNGTLKSVTKKGIQQWDVLLNFQTKRLVTHLNGTVTRSDVSLATKLNLKYRFLDGPDQRVHTEFKISNRSTNNIKTFHGDLRLECSAYPQFNFEATLKLQRALGHVDCKLEVNSMPHLKDPNHTLTAQFVFITTNEGRRMNTFLEIRRPATQLEIKLQYRYEQAGPKMNVYLLCRYAKDKDISVQLYLSIPSGTLLFTEGKLNVTLPSFTPMVLEGRIHEKTTSNFDVELKAVWFTGHNFTASGRYEDKSTLVASSYHLKLLIQSPSFHEINLACSFYRNREELKLEIKAEHNTDLYALLFEHKSPSSKNIYTHAEVKYKGKTYSVKSTINLKDYRQIMLEMHLDTARDIELMVRAMNKKERKELGIEIKWDANRDPDQKLMASVEFSNPEPYHYSGNFVLAYPGRSINGIFDFAIRDYYFRTFCRLAWSPTHSIQLKLSADYKYDAETLITIKSELLTPFDNWKKTSINGGYHHLGNMYRANGSVYWLQDQYVSLDVLGNYTVGTDSLRCEFAGHVLSTLPKIPSVSGRLVHFHNSSKSDSDLHVTYDPKKVIWVKSVWQIAENENMRNLTGTMSLKSPFTGYNKGLLVSKVYITKNMDIRGVADLDLDYKKYTASLEGHLQRVSESMFFFNITTPIEKYSKLTGRFGFSEQKRHFVAEVRAPSGAVGVEMLFYILNISDFDVKFNLATPIDFLRNVLVVATLKNDKIDFRLGWNKLMAGFTGVWHYGDLTDFEYSYKIYTPIEGLEENGVVAKFILKDGLDTEFSVQLANTKVGATVVGKPKPKLLKELGVKKTAPVYSGNRGEPADDEESDEEDEEGKEEISWTGLVQLDTIVWPTIKGTLDIDQTGPTYIVLVTLTLPDGVAELRDEFYFSDMLNMRNDMHLTTPYECYKEITSVYNLDIIIAEEYNIAFDVNILNRTEWVQLGAMMHYIHIGGDDEIEVHNGTVHIHTPFVSLPRLDVHGGLEIEENVYRINFTLATNTTDISVSGSGEADEGFLDTSMKMHVISPSLNLPPTEFKLKKDFSQAENILEVLLNVARSAQTKYTVKSLWHVRSLKHFKVELKTEVPIPPFEHFDVGVAVFGDTEVKSAAMRLVVPPHSIAANATVKDNLVHAEFQADLAGNTHALEFNGNIVKLSDKQHSLAGVLRYADERYDVTGNMAMYNDMPAGMDLELVPASGGEKITARYSVQPQESGCAVRSLLKRGDTFATLEAHVTVRHKFDWDLHVQVDTSLETYKQAIVDARLMTPNVNNMSFIFESTTPFRGLGHTKLGYSLLLNDKGGKLRLFHEMTTTRGETNITWRWILLEDMSVNLIGTQQIADKRKQLALDLFYFNPNKTFEYLKLGGDVNVDSGIWTFGSNLTLSLPSHEKIDVEAHLKLPPPKQDVHTIVGFLHSTKGMGTVEYLANYRSITSRQLYAASGTVHIKEKKDINGNLKLNWGPNAKQTLNNIVDLIRSDRRAQLLYRLQMAQRAEDTLNTRLTYTGDVAYHNVTAILFCPASKQIADVKVDFSELTNMNGTVNVTTPFMNLPWAGAHFIAETKMTNPGVEDSNRRVEAFWPNNTALVNSRYRNKNAATIGTSEATGVLLLDVPLTTRHVTKVDYGYDTKPLHATGHATINYNKNKIVQGKYKCNSESRAGFDKDTINVEVENKFVPIGLTYVHQYEYSAPGGGSNLPTVDFKHVEVFNLHNRTGFNITGEMHVNTTATGREISIKAIHSNRTVTLDADYDVQDQRFIQKSRLQLAPTVWIAYDLDIINKTEDESKEAQQIEINVSYPRRNFTLLGSYAVTDSSLFSEASLMWDRETQLKTVEAAFEWEQRSKKPNHQLVEFQIRHPSFERNVSFKGEYFANDSKLADVKLDVVYSAKPEQELHLWGTLDDHSNATVKNLTFEVTGSHPATSLKLNVRGDAFMRKKFYLITYQAGYKRTFLPYKELDIKWLLDVDNYEVEFEKKHEERPAHYWAKYKGAFPIYNANMIAERGSELNYSGNFYFNFKEKVLQSEVNLTADGSQSLHMYGVIPDARSATFNMWRDYEDIRVSDVAYFLRLNHSRLVVSSLKWRPQLKAEIKAAVKSGIEDFRSDFGDEIDYWKNYMRSETADAIKDIWEDAKPCVEGFLNDSQDMKVLIDDVEELKKFLNESYHANEFYIRDIVNAGMYVIDELSIRSHIESLPAIVHEIWEVMGESGEAIRNSIKFIVDTIKESYRKAVDFINGLVRGDTLEQLSQVMSSFVEKYDKFVKDLHVWFIRYMENLWEQVYVTIVDNWRKMLQRIEPAFITFAHYVESIVYQASKELLDFLYKHTSEIVESPYFTKFSLFTQDLDRLYKDFTNNDVFTLVYKYTNILVNFIKEKYAAMVPFGKELQDIANEILNELQELKKLPSIQYITAKVDEWYNKLKWFYDYFDVSNRVRYFVKLVHQKLTDMTMTALQAENRYREAKTNFIFEPKLGVMHLEQKLPLPWHAFNETPNFEEIPEYKTLVNLQNILVSSNTTFWALYYQYKPYTNPKDWLPPFTAHALIAGSQHYMTFDKQFYEFSGDCTYLLAHDFLDKNFSVAITYDPVNKGLTHKLHLLLRDEVIHIDVFANTVAVGNSTIGRLPTAVENDTFVYRDADILTVESMLGFVLRCNMKFDVCMFDVSGFYFGKTAGLWGTINNEPSDDFLGSSNHVVKHVGRFTQSWALRPQSCHSVTNLAVEIVEPDPAVAELCTSLFASKVSPFQACFERVHVGPFLQMCRNAGTELKACTSAVAYIQTCRVENTPLRIPDICVKCNLPNGTEVGEGEFVELRDGEIPRTTDVVFVVEAKECNANLRQKRNIDSLISLLDKELTDAGITKNRYSVVMFGGDGVFAKPRSLVINNEIFTTHQQIPTFFEDIPVGNNNSDIFGAINFAAQLVFRPGASKTFILMPCTDCDISIMKLDYTVLHQLLLENDITLHILMNEEFRFEKSRMNKVFYGMDSSLAYTNKDSRVLKGDADLRKQVRPPKALLGFCVPLALETNGTVFTGKKLEGDKRNAVKKFAAVFAKRVAKTAAPSSCQTCECNAHDNGVSFMECFPCQYPSPAYNDYDFNEDEALSAMQPMVDTDEQSREQSESLED